MFSAQILKKCLIPTVAVIAESKIKSETQRGECLCRPSELPIYTPEQEHRGPVTTEQTDETLGMIENAIRTTRQTLRRYADEAKAYQRVAGEQFNKSKENVEWLIDYLQEENNTMPKAGAIGIGALTGLIFGLRGGIFKKTLFATTGALGMGAVCYPKEAAEYSEVGVVEGKKYLTIAYNFLYGVKKDDPPLELPSLPKFSTSISDVWNSVKSTATSFVSDQEEKSTISEQVISSTESLVKNPLEVVTDSYDNAISKSCHCPIGACLGHTEDCPTDKSDSLPVEPVEDESPVSATEP